MVRFQVKTTIFRTSIHDLLKFLELQKSLVQHFISAPKKQLTQIAKAEKTIKTPP
jgi:hypothetical protein